MKLYVQLMVILTFSFAGEVLSTIFNLPVPGSIIGLILLFLALKYKIIRLRHIDAVGNFLLANMTILFLPPAVGLMEHFQDIKPYLFWDSYHYLRSAISQYSNYWTGIPMDQKEI